MGITVKTKTEIPESLDNIYRDISISPIDLLKNYALNHIYSKIHQYEVEDNHFRNKYNCSLQEFKHKVDHMKNEEIFEWEDDLMDWEFAVENLKLWRKKVQEIDMQ